MVYIRNPQRCNRLGLEKLTNLLGFTIESHLGFIVQRKVISQEEVVSLFYHAFQSQVGSVFSSLVFYLCGPGSDPGLEPCMWIGFSVPILIHHLESFGIYRAKETNHSRNTLLNMVSPIYRLDSTTGLHTCCRVGS